MEQEQNLQIKAIARKIKEQALDILSIMEDVEYTILDGMPIETVKISFNNVLDDAEEIKHTANDLLSELPKGA